MDKYFNVAGPCFPAKHYMLPALDRMPEIRRLVEQETYFVIHAPRQTGKTTALKALVREINDKGDMVALYCTLETTSWPLRFDKNASKWYNISI